MRHIEGEPIHAGIGIHAHGRDGQSDGSGQDALDGILPQQPCQTAESKDHQHEIFSRPESQCPFRQCRRQRHDTEERHQGPHERRPGRQGQRHTGHTLARQRIAVERGHHRCGITRHVDEDGGNTSTILRPHVDGRQQDQRGLWRQVHGIGDGDEHGHPVDGPQSWQQAHHRTEESAQGGKAQVHGCKGHAEALPQLRKHLTHNHASRIPGGRTTSRPRSNSRNSRMLPTTPAVSVFTQLPPNNRPTRHTINAVAGMKPRGSNTTA